MYHHLRAVAQACLPHKLVCALLLIICSHAGIIVVYLLDAVVSMFDAVLLHVTRSIRTN